MACYGDSFIFSYSLLITANLNQISINYLVLPYMEMCIEIGRCHLLSSRALFFTKIIFSAVGQHELLLPILTHIGMTSET
jgi:hypothetical protein